MSLSRPVEELSGADIAALEAYAQVIEPLHAHLKQEHVERFPHKGQQRVIQAFFKARKRVMQLQCGRNFGKTEVICYIAWRYALENPGAHIYIIAPTRKQGRDIYWLPKRLQLYGPQSVIEEHRDSEFRTVFKNGSWIIVDGCDNIDALRGIKPHLCIYEEFQNHTKEFDLAVMRPNLAAKRSQLIAIGTPPDKKCYYLEFREEILEMVGRQHPDYYYLELPTWTNPNIDRDWLKNERDRLFRKGEHALWEREYAGRYVPGGVNAVFPMYGTSRDHMLKSPSTLKHVLEREGRRLRWYCAIDPAQSCFAALLFAINPHTSQVFVVDEIYEKDRALTSTSKIWPRIRQMGQKWAGDWENVTYVCDEAASWFRNEVIDKYDVPISPTKKASRSKRDDISILKDLMIEEQRCFISKHCTNLDAELINYHTDENGKYIDGDDHLIDCWRYGIRFAGYSVQADVQPEEIHRAAAKYSLGQLLKDHATSHDLYQAIESRDGSFDDFVPSGIDDEYY